MDGCQHDCFFALVTHVSAICFYIYVAVLRRVRVNPRNAGTELVGTERGTPVPIPPTAINRSGVAIAIHVSSEKIVTWRFLCPVRIPLPYWDDKNDHVTTFPSMGIPLGKNFRRPKKVPIRGSNRGRCQVSGPSFSSWFLYF